MMEIQTQDRLREAILFLKQKRIIKTQIELSEIMQVPNPNLSKAVCGDPRYLTNSFLNRFNNTFNHMFNMNWLIYGEGNMLMSVNENNSEGKSTTSSFAQSTPPPPPCVEECSNVSMADNNEYVKISLDKYDKVVRENERLRMQLQMLQQEKKC